MTILTSTELDTTADPPALRAKGTPGPTDDFWYQTVYVQMVNAMGDLEITPQTAERIGAVHACVSVIAESVAMLPRCVHQHISDTEKVLDKKHPLWKILTLKPNRYMDSFTFFETMQRHVLLHGNGYAQIIRSKNQNQINELFPLTPTRITVTINDQDDIVYFYHKPNGTKVELSSDQIFHLKYHSNDGILGKSPIELSRDTVESAAVAQQYGTALFKNGARPDGILEVEGIQRDEEAKERLRNDWNKLHKGAEKQGGVAVLEMGTKYTPVAMKASDAQYIEIREKTVEDIARIFRVPPHMIQDFKRATFSNVEESGLNFRRFSLNPHLVRWQQAIESQLLRESEQGKISVSFKVRDIERGDFKSFSEGLANLADRGLINADEARFELDMNPIPDGKGKDFYKQVNMNTIDNISEGDEVDDKDPPKQLPEPKEDKSRNAIFRIFFDKIVTREINAFKRAVKKSDLKFQQWIPEFSDKHEEHLTDVLSEPMNSYWGSERNGRLADFVCDYCTDRRTEFAEFGRNYPIAKLEKSLRRQVDYWTNSFIKYMEN